MCACPPPPPPPTPTMKKKHGVWCQVCHTSNTRHTNTKVIGKNKVTLKTQPNLWSTKSRHEAGMYVCMCDKIQLLVPIYQVELIFDTLLSSRSVSHIIYLRMPTFVSQTMRLRAPPIEISIETPVCHMSNTRHNNTRVIDKNKVTLKTQPNLCCIKTHKVTALSYGVKGGTPHSNNYQNKTWCVSHVEHRAQEYKSQWQKQSNP